MRGSTLHKISTVSKVAAMSPMPATYDDPRATLGSGHVVPLVSALRRGGPASPARRPPLGRRLRDAVGASIPAESRIVFRAGTLSLR